MRTKGGGGLTHDVRTHSKKYQLFAYILQYFHLQRTLYRHLIDVVRIQLRLLLVQRCHTYGPQVESVNVVNMYMYMYI